MANPEKSIKTNPSLVLSAIFQNFFLH